jgi:membrane-bound serine protease (ClpP class)
MRRFVPLLVSLVALALLAAHPGVATAAAASPSTASATPTPAATKIDVIKVEGAIDRPLLGYLKQRLSEAEVDGAVVLLQLNTSGTLGQDAVALGQRIVDLRVPVLAWVGPTPAKAAGGGLLLMYAASLTAVSPGSQTGPQDPLDLLHPGAFDPGLRSTVQGWLDARHKNTRLGWRDRPLTAQDALDLGIATVAATSVPGLLDQVDGTTVQTAAGPVVLHTRIATDEAQANVGVVDVRFDNMGPVKRIAHGVASPSMIYFLVVLGLACLAFELTQPGFGFAGFAGVGMLGLAAYGIWVVPPTWYGFALLVGGVGLMTLDVRMRKLGPLTAIGVFLFGLGSAVAWRGVAPAIEISPWLIGGAVIASVLYYGFALTVAQQSRDRIVNTQRGLIGLVGEARGRLAPEGPVYVKGAMWRGRASGEPIAPGTPVRVRGVDGLVLRVEPEPGATPTLRGPVPQPAD